MSDIAEHAEVARRIFFRYFPDKRGVLFADDGELNLLLAEAIERAAGPLAPLGDSLPHALHAVRVGLLALAEADVQRHAPARDRLIAASPQLQVCSQSKERAHIATALETLLRHGTGPGTARLAAHLSAGCYTSAHAEVAEPHTCLPIAVDAAFQRLTTLA